MPTDSALGAGPRAQQIERAQASSELGYSMADMFCYLFYLPLFFTGPILTYDLFRQQVRAIL